MELKDLAGRHVFSGVDTTTIPNIDGYNKDVNCNVINFILDGVTYSVIGDADDGYRSSMKEIKVVNIDVKNQFQPVDVYCNYEGNGSNDILKIIAVQNNKLILEVGTDYSDVYYPNFVSSFMPENMPVNAALKAEIEERATINEPVVAQRPNWGTFE